MRFRALFLVVLTAVAVPAGAQDDNDGRPGLVGRQIERALSGPGREANVVGFAGVLSGRATMERLTFADADGVWLSIENAVLDWDRGALFQRRLSVQELSAEAITVTRAPLPAPAEDGLPEPPPAAASGFSLPELPVAIEIGALAVERLTLGAPILGEEATFTADGAVSLAGGEGAADLSLVRTGAAGDRYALTASFDNASRVLGLDLEVREAPGGLAGTLLDLPDSPAIALDAEGTGPLDDYTAEIDLATDEQPRVTGTVTLRGEEAGGLRFAADIGGDVTPLIAPQYSGFFGPDVQLAAEGLRGEDGALDLERLRLSARSLDLSGSLALGPDGVPERFALEGRLADPEGGRVRLPAEAPVTLDRVDLAAAFDAAAGEAWTLDLTAREIATEAANVGSVTISGGGTIAEGAAGPRVTADLDYAAEALALADPALAEAVGDRVGGRAAIAWEAGAPLGLAPLTLGGADYGLEITGDAVIAERTLRLDGAAALSAEDLSRFSAVAGRPLTGAADLRLDGEADVLGGLFDLALDLEGRGLSVGQEVADRFLAGPVTLSAAAARDTEGTQLERFELESPGLSAEVSGRIGAAADDLALDLTLADLGLLRPDLEGPLRLVGTVEEIETGLFEIGVDLSGAYGAAGTVAGRVGTGEAAGRSDLTLDVALPDIQPIVPALSGRVALQGQAAEAGRGLWRVDLAADGPAGTRAAIAGEVGPDSGDVTLDVEVPDIAAFAPGVPGAATLGGRAVQERPGAWRIALDAGLPYDGTAELAGLVAAEGSDLDYSARLPDLGALSPALTGAMEAQGTARQTPAGRWEVTADASGPYQATAQVRALVGAGTDGTGRTEADATVSLPDVGALAPRFAGALTAEATAAQTAAGAWDVAVDADGPYASTLTASGTLGAGRTDATARVSLPDVAPLAPRFTGALTLEATAAQDRGAPIEINADAAAPYGVTANVEGRLGQGEGRLRLSTSVPSVSPFAAGLTGSLSVSGTATERPEGWALDIQSRGPGEAAAAVAGIVTPDRAASSLRVQGGAPLGLLNGILAPQRLAGDIRFDLALDGEPGLDQLSGTLSTSNARLAIPAIDQALEEISLTGDLAGGQITVSGTAASARGGRLAIEGPITLSGAFPADLTATLDALALEDPSLYRTTLDGEISLSGPLRGTGGVISGGLRVGPTELRIPSGGVGFGGAIPRVTHVAEPGTVRLTRDRAGLINERREARGDAPPRNVYALDLVIDAPNQVFLRGRGLDAELGGRIEVGGTTRTPAPVGGIEVIRGRLDLLGRRLELQQDGRVTLGGDLQPFLDLVATSDDAQDFTILIAIEGPVSEPAFTFSSQPPLPEDEVLARFFFDKGLANLSPIQAAQLAASVARLTGRGGPGLLSGVRESLGVDDFDVVTGEDGEAALQVGKYLSENIYTDVTTSTTGQSAVNLNIDVTDTITLKGSADSAGDTSVGIFFERDY